MLICRTCRNLRTEPFSPGTVVFPKIGAAIATNKKRKITVHTLIDNNMMGVTVSATHKCDEAFLFHWFRSVDLVRFANVSAVPSIPTSNVKQAVFALPRLAEQEAIARVLDSIDNALETSRKYTGCLEVR